MTRHPTLVVLLWTAALVLADHLARQRGWW
jgi:hypothetical protein